MLQIPVEGGHVGGELTVRHPQRDTKLDHSLNSDRKFFLSSYFLDCSHEISPITEGRSLILQCQLVWRKPIDLIPNMRLSTFSALSTRVQKLLNPWTNPALDKICVPQLLVFPIDHDVQEYSLEYDTLADSQKLIIDLLCSVEALELRLSVITCHVTGIVRHNLEDNSDSSEATDEELEQERNGPSSSNGFINGTKDVEFFVENFLFLGGDNSVEKKLPIDWSCEFIRDIKTINDLFDISTPPHAEQDFRILSLENARKRKQSWYQPVLIAWHSDSIPIRCRRDLKGTVLTLKESVSSITSDREHWVRLWELEQIVTYCLQKREGTNDFMSDTESNFSEEEDSDDPLRLPKSTVKWDSTDTNSLSLLFEICCELKAQEQGLRLFHHFVYNYQMDWLDDFLPHLIDFVSVIDWKDCRDLLDVFFYTISAQDQMTFKINLTLGLLQSGNSRSKEAGSKIFQLLSSQLFSAASDYNTFSEIVNSLDCGQQVSVLLIIVILQLEGLLQDVVLISSTIVHLNNLEFGDLDFFVDSMCESSIFNTFCFANLSADLQKMFINLCHHFFDVNPKVPDCLVNWFDLFSFVRDPSLLQSMADRILMSGPPGRENRYLQKLMIDQHFMRSSRFATVRNLLFRYNGEQLQPQQTVGFKRPFPGNSSSDCNSVRNKMLKEH